MLEHMKSHVRMLDVRGLTFSLVINFLSNVNLSRNTLPVCLN